MFVSKIVAGIVTLVEDAKFCFALHFSLRDHVATVWVANISTFEIYTF